MNLIDKPNPFSSLEEWVVYRRQLDSLTNVPELIREADERIAELRKRT